MCAWIFIKMIDMLYTRSATVKRTSYSVRRSGYWWNIFRHSLQQVTGQIMVDVWLGLLSTVLP